MPDTSITVDNDNRGIIASSDIKDTNLINTGERLWQLQRHWRGQLSMA